MNDAQQRAQLELLARLNRRHLQQHDAEAELAARINSFELAYRMQQAAPEAIDISRESKQTHKLYGLDNKKCAHFATQRLMPRRPVARRVRYVQHY